MPQLLDLPFELLERILKFAVLDRTFSLFVGQRCQAPKSRLAAILSLRLVHSNFRLAADPFIFTNFDFQIGNRNDTGEVLRDSGALKLLVTPGISQTVRGITAYTIPFESGNSIACTSRDERYASIIDQLLQPPLPRLEGLRLVYDRLVEPGRIRLWQEIRAAPLPRLVSLTVMDMSLSLYVPFIARQSPLLKTLSVGGSGTMDPNSFEQLWAAQGNVLQLASNAIPVLDDLRIYYFEHGWVQRYLKHLSLRSRKVCLCADLQEWAGSLPEQKTALQSLSRFEELEEVIIENMVVDECFTADEVEEYEETAEPQRLAIFDQFVEDAAYRKTKCEIQMFVISDDWAENLDEGGGEVLEVLGHWQVRKTGGRA